MLTFNPSTTSASVVLPTMRAINGVFGRLDQVAPAAVSADMAALTSYWSQVKAHPPAQTATINAKVQHLSDYLTTTCHINMSS